MPPIIESRANRGLHYWGPSSNDLWGADVIQQRCPEFLLFDDTESLTFDSSCRIFDHGEDDPMTFDSTIYLFDGTAPVMDGDT